jgi:galactose mutarotase-like enzyme
MIETLQNDFFKIEIATMGAELKSIYNKHSEEEYLWQGLPDWWPRRAPVLFPIVGKLNNNTYRVNGKTFSLPQHGFARDNEFTVGHRNESSVEFILKSNDAFMLKYPFQFELKIRYSLEENRLQVAYQVSNNGSAPMPFSIGAHPGFALRQGETLADYYLEFEKAETLDRHLLEDGLFNGKTERVVTEEKALLLNDDLFRKDAIVFKNMKSTWLHLKSKNSDYKIKISYAGFPYFGIWSKPGASFLCLEPWCGMADRSGFEGYLNVKEGIQTLVPEGIFHRSFYIEIG